MLRRKFSRRTRDYSRGNCKVIQTPLIKYSTDPLPPTAVCLGTLRELLDRILAAQAAQGAVLDRIVQALEALGRGRLGAGDLALLDTIAAHVGVEVAFSATELWRHAERVDDALRATIAAAGVTSTRTLGRRLRRIARHAPGPVRLVCVGRDADATWWTVAVDRHDSHARRAGHVPA